MRLVSWSILALALILAPASATPQPDAPRALPADETALPSMMHCPVEGHEVRDGQHRVVWNGREYYLGTEMCQRAFLEDPERYARGIEPRAALFRAQNPSKPSMGPSLLVLSLLFVLGLLCGAVASYTAVQKGLSGVRWFAYGVVFNVFALVAVARIAANPQPFQREGLAKVPATHAPLPCPSCGRENHPAAEHCSRCATTLTPGVEADTARV